MKRKISKKRRYNEGITRKLTSGTYMFTRYSSDNYSNINATSIMAYGLPFLSPPELLQQYSSLPMNQDHRS
jgi:hypothetical protein